MAKVMTHLNGFQITLPGGYRVSFAFGQGSYADNRYAGMGTISAPDFWESSTFELAVFDPEGEMMDQWRVYNEIVHALPTERRLRMMVQASAGTGKSFLLTSLCPATGIMYQINSVPV